MVPVGLHSSGQPRVPPPAIPPAGSKTPPFWPVSSPLAQHQLQCRLRGSKERTGPLQTLVHLLCRGLSLPAEHPAGGAGNAEVSASPTVPPLFLGGPCISTQKAQVVGSGVRPQLRGLSSFLCPCLPPPSFPAVGLLVPSSLGASPSRAKRRKEARPVPSRAVTLDLGFHRVSSSLAPTSPPRGGFPPAGLCIRLWPLKV